MKEGKRVRKKKSPKKPGVTQNLRNESIPKTIFRILWISELLLVSVVVGLCFLDSTDGKGNFPCQLWPTDLGSFLEDNTWG